MKRAFATAPWPNLDGGIGITLHVDAGPLVDPFAFESAFRNTCTNAINDDGDAQLDLLETTCRFSEFSEEIAGDCGAAGDQDGDGLSDALDPQCRVEDNFGGGQQFPVPIGACGLGEIFVATKAAAFNPNRQRIFHYAIHAAAPPHPPLPAAPLQCQGGQGERGGDDFISHNLDTGTLMHELGHNLNLQHGGTEGTDCKPNYLSVMNYNLQFGIPHVGGGFILDYLPPRQALDGSTRSFAPLAPLVENALDETVFIDTVDGEPDGVHECGKPDVYGADECPRTTTGNKDHGTLLEGPEVYKEEPIMRFSVRLAAMTAVCTLPATLALAQGQEGASSGSMGERSPDQITCADITAMDTRLVPGVLYYISGYEEGSRASVAGASESATGADAGQAAMPGSSDASGSTTPTTAGSAGGTSDPASASSSETAQSPTAGSDTAASGSGGSATAMSGTDPSSTGGSPATASNGNASSTPGEGGSTAAASSDGASGDTSAEASTGASTAGDSMNVVRVTGMFEIPVEQVMVVCGQSPEMTASDAVEQNRGSSSSTN